MPGFGGVSAFQFVNDDQVAFDAEPGWGEEKVDVIGRQWYEAVDEVLTAPSPQTATGRGALANAAQVALMAGVSGSGRRASKEKRRVVKALEGLAAHVTAQAE